MAEKKLNTFENVKRNFENAYASGADYSAELTELATAVAYSVLKKCLDPQRKTAVDREEVSNNGQNPTLQAVRRGIRIDYEMLAGTRYTADRATRATLNAEGDPVTEIVDKTAYNALAALMRETLSDGIDLVQSAALAILEEAATHAAPGTWLDTPYTIRRLSKRVYIREVDSAAYREDTTTPIQEVYRAVRREVQNSRAIQTDPRNGYSYIEDIAPDGVEKVYIRLGKYADLGGYAHNSNDNTRLPGSPAGLVQGPASYTTDLQAVEDYNSIMEKLNLTPRQETIVRLRMQGHGNPSIASYLGVTPRCIEITVARLREKAAKMGIAPKGYTQKTA